MGAEDSQADARILEEAASWLEKIERTISREDGQALKAWLSSVSHREAIVERCKRWHGPEILAVLGELIPVETFAEKIERQYHRLVLAILLSVMAIGTMTVMITASRFFPGMDARGNPLRAESIHETAVGERKTVKLPDGGSIVLNTASRVRLVYRPRYRDASLSSGEATFNVQYDPERPFVVDAGVRAFEVQSGGAHFNLRRMNDEKVELTVLAGKVRALARRLDSVSPALLRSRVTYGERLFSAAESGTLGPGWQSAWTLGPEKIERRLAWHSGRMIFHGERLDVALRELERYTVSRFVLTEEELGATRLTGVFRVGDVDGFRQYLREHLGIDSKVSDPATIVLTRSAASKSEDAVRTYIDCLSNDSCRRLNDGRVVL